VQWDQWWPLEVPVSIEIIKSCLTYRRSSNEKTPTPVLALLLFLQELPKPEQFHLVLEALLPLALVLLMGGKSIGKALLVKSTLSTLLPHIELVLGIGLILPKPKSIEQILLLLVEGIEPIGFPEAKLVEGLCTLVELVNLLILKCGQ